MNEAFYCPEVKWTLPDGTHRSEESDCDPYSEESAKSAQLSWVLDVPERTETEGENCVEVVLQKNGHLLARQQACFTILGGD